MYKSSAQVASFKKNLSLDVVKSNSAHINTSLQYKTLLAQPLLPDISLSKMIAICHSGSQAPYSTW